MPALGVFVNLLEKLKESAISVIPVMAVVVLLHLSMAPLGDRLGEFLVGGVLLIFGLSIFLLGADIGVLPVGQQAGSALTSRRNLPLLLGAGFAIGFFITVAEPDVHVLAQQVAAVDPSLSPLLLVGMIAVGVGLFVTIALARVVFQISLRLLFLLFLCDTVGEGGKFRKPKRFAADAFIPAEALDDLGQFFLCEAQISLIEQAVQKGFSALSKSRFHNFEK